MLFKKGSTPHNKTPENKVKEICSYFHTELSQHEIKDLVGVGLTAIRRIFRDNFTEEENKHRYSVMCSVGKRGSKNHMHGKLGKDNPRYTGNTYINELGYRMVPVPDWWSGKRVQRIPEHHKVYCEQYGLTKLPKGTLVHHINFDKLDNSIGNLQLMTRPEHMSYHAKEYWSRKGATTIPEGSREQCSRSA